MILMLEATLPLLMIIEMILKHEVHDYYAQHGWLLGDTISNVGCFHIDVIEHIKCDEQIIPMI